MSLLNDKQCDEHEEVCSRCYKPLDTCKCPGEPQNFFQKEFPECWDKWFEEQIFELEQDSIQS